MISQREAFKIRFICVYTSYHTQLIIPLIYLNLSENMNTVNKLFRDRSNILSFLNISVIDTNTRTQVENSLIL